MNTRGTLYKNLLGGDICFKTSLNIDFLTGIIVVNFECRARLLEDPLSLDNDRDIGPAGVNFTEGQMRLAMA